MRSVGISLAVTCALMGIANAQSLENAIKGVEVSGYLRYEYEDNRYKNQGFQSDNNGNGTSEHIWHAEAEFKTPVQNNVALNLGIYYDNANNVNHGKGSPANTTGSFLGEGLGSGKDSDFGVSTFNAIITPDSTSTNITLGKMRLDTPLNDSDEDRGTGILAVNNDISNLNFVAGAFDSWALDDLSDALPDSSIAKPLYTLAVLGNYGLGSLWNIEAQAWYFHVDDIVDSAVFTQLSLNHNNFAYLSGQYIYTQTNNDGVSAIATALGGVSGEYQTKSDFISVEAGVDFAIFDIPLSVSAGYIANTKDNFAVSLDDEGALQMVGAVWFDNYDATGVNFSAINGAIPLDTQKELSVMYGSLAYAPLENLSFGIDYISGSNKVTNRTSMSAIDYDFYEITPNILWQFSENIEILTYYAFLKTERSGEYVSPDANSENRNQFKIEAIYSF